LLGGHVAWSAHLVVGYFIAARAGALEFSTLNSTISGVATAATLGAIAAAWFERRRAHADPVRRAAVSAERHFLADVALALGCVFLFAIALAAVASALLSVG
jgi:hypothetical protein